MKTKTILIALFAMLAVTAIVFQSCKKDKPKDPTPPVYTNGQGEIGEIGGTVKINDPSSPINGASVIIPEGALKKDVDIKIVEAPSGIFVDGDTEVILAGFEPEGLKFEKPVEITLPYGSVNSENLRAFYYNHEEHEVSQIPVTSINNGTIKATTNHFSYYFATDGNFGLAIEMLNINGKIGARLNYMSFNGDDGLENIPAVSYDNAHEATINSGDEVYSYFKVTLYEDDFWSNNNKGTIDLKLQKYKNNGIFKAYVILNGSDAYQTDELTENVGGTADLWFEGTPLIFYFNDFTPTTNDSYFVKARWRLTRHKTNIDNWVQRYTDLYEVNNEDDDKKLSEMQSFSINDLYAECIDENYIGGTGAKPSVTTNDASYIDCSGARLNGKIDDVGSSQITQYGFCISENPNPTIDGQGVVNLGTTTNTGSIDYDYRFDPPALEPATKYYYRAYAKNSAGVSYGNDVEFWTGDDNDKPTFQGTQPANGATISGNVNIVIAVVDECGLDKVVFSAKKSGNSYFNIGDDLNPEYMNNNTYHGTTDWNTNNVDNGNYIIRAWSCDNAGNCDEKEWNVTVNNSGSNTPPTAQFTVSPSSGTTSTNFAFDASGSTDNQDPTSNLQVRWDFDGNGSWDTGWDYDKTVNHQYSSENTYTAKLEVKDTEGLTDDYTKSITVSNGGGNTGTFTDPRDGQTYATIDIGSQTWFAENLNYETTNSWWYDNSSANGDVYGRLYTWDAAMSACPAGWHLPSDEEWKTLEMYLGMSQSEADDTGYRGTDEGEKMKSTSGWNNNGNGTNSSGFNALPGGYHYTNGSFGSLGDYGLWWSSSESSGTNAWNRSLYYDTYGVGRGSDGKEGGRSVRCLKD